MIVKALKIPVRYKGVTHPSGQVFDMEEEHFNSSLVVNAEEESEVPKYSKAADRGLIIEKAEETQVPVEDYSTFSESELKKVKNEKLEAYLDAKGVKYASDAIKEDYINLILGE